MTQERALDRIVGQIYESVQEVDLLRPAMELIDSALGGVVSHYVHLDNRDQSVIKSLVSNQDYTDGDIRYSDYYSRIDPRLPWFTSAGPGIWRADYERFDDRFVKRNEFYNEFLFKLEIRHMTVTKIGGKPGQPQSLAIGRPLGSSEFSREDHKILDFISPHLVRASKLRDVLDDVRFQENISKAEASRLPYGTVWLDGYLKVAAMNAAASEILKVADGIGLKDGRLQIGEPKKMAELTEALRLATRPVARQGGWLAVRRRMISAPLIVSVVPAMAHDADGKNAVLIILHDSSRHVFPHAEKMMALFGLTAAEARLAQALVENETIESFAEKSGVSRSTAKSHLKSIFAKTGTNRQAELVRSLLLIFSGVVF